MDKTTLSAHYQNLYIPVKPAPKSNSIPPHHPSLIVQDAMQNTPLECGCLSEHCIEEKMWWSTNSGATDSTKHN